MGAPEKREAISGSLIDKLLNNPHMEIQREPRRYRLSTETDSQNGIHEGVQQGNPAAFVANSLTEQSPLLDGGEGEFQPNTVSMDIDTHAEQEIPTIRETISSHPPRDLPSTVSPVMKASTFSGLKPPKLDSTSGVVMGADTPKHRIENKQRRQATLANHAVELHWTIYKGEIELPDQPMPLTEHQGEMCPSRLALCHPAGRSPLRVGHIRLPYQHRKVMDCRADASCNGQGTSSFGSTMDGFVLVNQE